MTWNDALYAAFVGVYWLGHACIMMAILNRVYALPLPKKFLKPFRLLIGLLIFTFPFCFHLLEETWITRVYRGCCLGVAAGVLPIETIRRLLRKTPTTVVGWVLCIPSGFYDGSL
jgi:hypothetical protein